LDATNLFPSGYNTSLATIETITSIVPYVENTICCPNVISDFTAEDHMNRVDWILDSGASLHSTGDMNDFIEYTPLEKNITANTATSANTQIIGKGTVMMAIEGSEHMVRIAPVFYVPDLSMRLLSLGVFLRGGLQLNGNTERISLLQDGQEFLTFLPRWDGATIFIIRTYLGAKPSIRAAEQIFHPDFETYHRRFAHPSNDVLHKIGKYTYGLPSQIQIPENHICPGCEQGKKMNKSFPSTKARASKPFELVHSDLKSFPVESYCHDFRRFPTFLCLSPKRPHLFTQPMTCFPFPFPHNIYLIFLFGHFGYQGQVRSIRFTWRLVSLGLPKEFYLLGSHRPFKPHCVHVGDRPLDLLHRGHLRGIQDLGQG